MASSRGNLYMVDADGNNLLVGEVTDFDVVITAGPQDAQGQAARESWLRDARFSIDAEALSEARRLMSQANRITGEDIIRILGAGQDYQRNHRVTLTESRPLHDVLYHIPEYEQPVSEKRCKIHPATRNFLEQQRQRQQRKAGKR